MSITYHHPHLIFTYYCVVPHPDDERILLVQSGDTYSLPSFSPEEHHFGVVDHINRTMAGQYGVDGAVLRCLGDEYADNGEEVYRYYVMDILSPLTPLRDDVQWVDVSQLSQNAIPEVQRAFIAKWREIRQQPDERRAPWTQPGWYAEARSVLRDFADRMDMHSMGRVEQVRAWSRSSVLRIKTDKGYLYLKAVPSVFNSEARLTRIFSLRYPPHIPRVLAVSSDKHWMLMAGHEGELLSSVKDITVWERALKRYAKLQMDLEKSARALMNMGVPDRHVDLLASQVEQLATELPSDLTEEEQDQFRRNVRLLRSMCYELMDYNVPITLLHGDFWPGNLAIRPDDQEPIFFDWSDSAVTHPFFDLPFFLDDIEDMLPGVPNLRQRLRDAYLSQWTRYETPGRLRNMYRICRVIGPLHYALTYHTYVLPNIAPDMRWEMAAMLPLMIRKVLIEFDRYQAAEQ
ncbi:aminoglycoside phosphotransferase family protein [Phototrophicus methaneseepsis]|uniref:Aminoglycoside phosphotransferase family protein n=1 Tax=Phototrophicus methaneseepsis TaxID=2710758 RepID=A0A7S8E9E1_9CHLR|nr:aminoglycoside phosphotransferase family protein [Phototrophicus methaneseepsis]QPC82654.1 aminoglycoside phosphotransferase family protein [Phototrophicus methaneseepsis]